MGIVTPPFFLIKKIEKLMSETKKLIKLLPFGCPFIQNHYKNLCNELNISFETFQEKLIESTNKSYDELKDFLTDGEIIDVCECDISITQTNNILIIHFDIEKPDVMAFAMGNTELCDVFTDGKDLFSFMDIN